MRFRLVASIAFCGMVVTGCQMGQSNTVAVTRGTLVSQVCDKEACNHIHFQYWLYLPEGYTNGEKRWPLMFYLHGAGERGDDLQLLKKNGPLKLVDQGKDFPFIIAAPQCRKDQWWQTDELNAFLDEMIARYNVDEDRVYLTGLSMGGFGTWALACRCPERFAAIAPVCGGGVPFLARLKLKHTPVWAFHGAKDQVVPLAESQRLVEAIQQAGGDATLTIYPKAKHNAWTETYNNPKLYEWLLSHRRP